MLRSKLLKANSDIKKIIEHVQNIDNKVSYKGFRPLIWGLCGTMILTYLNKDRLNNLVTTKAKNLTQETIEDEKVKLKAQEMLTQIITSQETKQALYQVFQDLFNDPKSQESLAVFLKDSATKTMNDNEFKKTTSSYCWQIIKSIFTPF